MAMREPEEAFLVKLKAYDPLLNAEWVEKTLGGEVVQRWRITRQSRSGRPRHIMFVVGPRPKLKIIGAETNKFGSYRPLDERVIARLRECDSFRFYGQDWNKWESQGRKAMMNAKGMREDDEDSFVEAHSEEANRRYHSWVPELASRIEHYYKQNPHAQVTGIGADVIRDAEERAELAEEVAASENDNDAQYVMDKKLGVARRVR